MAGESSAKSVKKKASGLTPWKKGQTGNPKGRPPIVRSIQELCRAEGPASVRTLVMLRDDKKAPAAVRNKCSMDLLAYGFGRPVETKQLRVIQSVQDLTNDELEAMLREATTHDIDALPGDVGEADDV